MKLKKKQEQEKLMETRLNYIYSMIHEIIIRIRTEYRSKRFRKKKQLRDGMINRGKQIKSCNNRGHGKRKMRS